MAIHTAPNDDMARQRLRKEGGAWLRQCREEAGLSQRELAERVDVGYYTFVSQIEAGRGRIPAERYSVWAKALGMNARDFVRNIMAFYEPTTYDILFGKDESA
ncbi:helix-turn-helix domain-containing protein [Aurantimonas coralicida]|uniref:helix-turn-helix domain-containing protein n=1 Tax=Aurantimonas coralicida TaxID=182270 RepID=UPI0039B6F569